MLCVALHVPNTTVKANTVLRTAHELAVPTSQLWKAGHYIIILQAG